MDVVTAGGRARRKRPNQDEAHNLSTESFEDLPVFHNFAFDSRDRMTAWLVGHPALAHLLDRAPYAALAGRIQVRVLLDPVVERERFAQLIQHALKTAGCPHTLLADSGLELLRLASQGLPRQAGRILRAAMQRAVPKGHNQLPRPPTAGNRRGTAMIIDLDTLFPEGLSDETICAIGERLNDLAMRWESHFFFQRIRSDQARLQTDLFDPDQPGRRKTND